MAREPKPPVELMSEIESYDTPAGVSYDSEWTVGAGSAAGFTTAWATHFACAIQAKSTADAGIVDILMKWCDKTTKAASPDSYASIIASASFTAGDVVESSSVDCPANFYVDGFLFRGVEYAQSTSNNMGFIDIFVTCRNFDSGTIHYYSSTSSEVKSALFGTESFTNNNRQDNVFAPDNHGVCGFKTKYHSPASGDKFGLIGFKVLYCEHCLGTDECYPDTSNKPKAGSDGKVPPFFFTGSNIYKDDNTVGNNIVGCFDQTSDEGLMVFGGMTQDPNVHTQTQNSGLPFPWIGLKRRSETMDADSWSWIRILTGGSQQDFSFCKFSPTIEILSRQMIVAISRTLNGQSQVHYIDPGKGGDSTGFHTWYTTALYSTNDRYQDKMFLQRTVGVIVRTIGLANLETITYSAYSTLGQASLVRVTYNYWNQNTHLSTFYIDPPGSSSMMFGFACLETTEGELYFGTGKNIDASQQAPMIIRYVHDNYKTWDYVTDDFSATGKGLSIVHWPRPYETSKFVDVVSLLAYYDRLVGFIHRHLATAADVEANIGDTAGFVGQCDPTDFASFWRLEFKLPLKFNVWPKAMHAKDSKTSYAVVTDYYTDGYRTSEIYFLKFHFDPDPSDCSALVSLSEPKVTYMVNHDWCDPYDMCHFFTADYMPSADAMAYTGTSLKFKGGLFSTQRAYGFLAAVTLAEIDAATQELAVTPTFDASLHADPRTFNQVGISQAMTSTTTTWVTPTIANIQSLTLTTDACAGDLTLSSSSEFTSGFLKNIVWDQNDPSAQVESIALTNIFSQANAAACPITECFVNMYESTADIYSDPAAADPFLQSRCRFPHTSSKISYDAAGKAIKITKDAIEIFHRICVVCKNDVEAVKSQVFDVEVVTSPCVLQPIQPTTDPIAERQYEYNVYYDLDSKRFPTASWNVSEVVIDLIEEKLITVEALTVCAPTAYAISQVLQNDSATVVPPAIWSPYISIDTATGKITVSKYGNADPDFFRNISIQIEASNEFQNLPATSLVKLSFVENVTLEVSKPPVFVEELEHVEIKIATFGKGEAITVTLPEVTDANGDTIEPLQVYVHGPYEHFLQYDASTTTLTFLPDKITPKDAEDFAEFAVPIRILDHRGEVTEDFLDCTISAKPPQPEPEAEEESDGFIGVVIPVEEPEEDEKPEVALPPPPPAGIPKLRAFFKDISTLGVLTIGLNLPFKPIDISLLDETAISMRMAPGESPAPVDFNYTSLEFVWECTGVNLADQEITFQLNFTDAVAISPVIQSQDQLTIHFKKPDLFVSRDYNEQLVANSYQAQGAVRKQMPNTPASQNFDEGTEQTGNSLVVATLVSQGLTIFFHAAMKELLGTILALQVIVHLFLMMVPFPGNISNFVSKLKPIASFNILKVVTKYTIKVFNFDVDAQNALRKKIITPAQDLGIKQHNAVQNLGNVFHLLGYYFFSILLLLIYRIRGHFSEASTAKFVALKKSLFFGHILKVLVSGFISISIACYFQLRAPLSSTIGERLGVIAAYVSVFCTFGFLPASLIYILVVDKETLEKPGFKQVWGSLYGNVRIDTRSQRAFRHVFLLRRLLILAVGFMLFEEPPLQMIAVNVMNISVVLFQGLSEPFKGKFDNRLDLFNEAMVTFITYHLFMFSDVLPEADAQYLIGWSFVVMLSIMLGGNSFFVIRGMLKNFYLLLKRRLNKRRMLKQKLEMIQSVLDDTQTPTSINSPATSQEAKRRRSQKHKKTLSKMSTDDKLKVFKLQSESYSKKKRLSHANTMKEPKVKQQLSIIREETDLVDTERGEFSEQLYCQLYGVDLGLLQKYKTK